MKEITIQVEDSAYECVLGMLQLCQQVEVMSTGDLQGMTNSVDECFAKAIKELQDDKVLRNQYDYAFIYLAIREGLISGVDPFYSVQSFVDYLKGLGISNPPCKNSISNICTHTRGDYPEWQYDDYVDANEERRRRIIVTRFSSVFTRLKRELGR